jgi:hypothetical protein
LENNNFCRIGKYVINEMTAGCVVPRKPVHMFILVKEAIKGHIFESAATQGVLCGGDPATGTSKACLPQCQSGLFLTASVSSPIQSSNRFCLNNPCTIYGLAVISRPPVEKQIYIVPNVTLM